jgi:hypothetical protein
MIILFVVFILLNIIIFIHKKTLNYNFNIFQFPIVFNYYYFLEHSVINFES